MFPEKLISSLRAHLLPHHSNKQQPFLRKKTYYQQPLQYHLEWSLHSALLETYYAKRLAKHWTTNYVIFSCGNLKLLT